MYTSLKITNFRCFDELALDDIARVNLVAGKNNVGKTALLEALFIHCGATNPLLAVQTNANRGLKSWRMDLSSKRAETPWASLFKGYSACKPIEIAGEHDAHGRRVLKLSASEGAEREALRTDALRGFLHGGLGAPKEAVGNGNGEMLASPLVRVLTLESKQRDGPEMCYLALTPGGFRTIPTPLPRAPFQAAMRFAREPDDHKLMAERFSRVEVAGKLDSLLGSLRLIEPRLKSATLAYAGDAAVIFGDVGVGHLLPLPVMGDGMVALTSIMLHMIQVAGDGVLLVDEVDNGLHHTVMRRVWEAVGKAARELNVQVFATTHSYECIIAAYEAFSGKTADEFRLHRLEMVDGRTRAVTYDPGALRGAIEAGLEVR